MRSVQGSFPSTGSASPKESRQPNKGKGVKVESKSVQAGSFLIHQPFRALGVATNTKTSSAAPVDKSHLKNRQTLRS
jgi:hypothetical protein